VNVCSRKKLIELKTTVGNQTRLYALQGLVPSIAGFFTSVNSIDKMGCGKPVC
jgi:hypothetical protein